MRPVAFALLVLPAVSFATVLYDGASNVLPSQSPWVWGYAGTGGVVTPPNGSQKTTLDTTAALVGQAGWINVSLAPLDAAKGYSVTFDVRLVSETHVSYDRAGLAVIVIGQDKKGLELSFWPDRVWAQDDSPLFVHAEEALLNTTAFGLGRANLRRCTLHFFGGSYTLFVDGAYVLGGPRRDYTAFAGFPNPYIIPNVLFVGDNTTSAQARLEWSHWSVRTGAGPIPAPGKAGITIQ
ncbi:MAG: hypothetical protein KIT11_00395 [Fimbriimonadaceae bacterium]|nr:hypothetical protein [Fimbriimonadaceae bacterium]QYK55168.1 MAG: hypothetical protein KF733_09140 [Fimbriimonadaceae bacterium]